MESDQESVSKSETTSLVTRRKSTDDGDAPNTFPEDPRYNKNAFYKKVKILDPSKVKREELVQQLKQRFQIKSKKWEARATQYSIASFLMTFMILVCQVAQMIILPLRDTSIPDKYYTVATTIVSASTALIVGFQLKLKLHHKIMKLQKGVEIYNRMLRSTSYYLMMIECGGEPAEDGTIVMWKQALEAEIEDVPVMRNSQAF